MITLADQSTAGLSEEYPLPDTGRMRTSPAEIARRFWSGFAISGSEEDQTFENLAFGTSSAQLDFSTTAAGTESDGREVADLPQDVGPVEKQRVSFHPLQEWEGYVTAVRGNTFTARLTDLTENATRADEEADFPTDDVVEEDRELLAVGRVFRWVVGYMLMGSTKFRASHIVFRRLRWTKEDLARAEEEGRELAAKIKWE
jgi:hypothetical protein